MKARRNTKLALVFPRRILYYGNIVKAEDKPNMFDSCTHHHDTDTVPPYSMYYFPDSTSTNVIDISVVPLIESPKAAAYLRQNKNSISKPSGTSSKKLEDAVVTAEQFLSTMSALQTSGKSPSTISIPVRILNFHTKRVSSLKRKGF